MLCCSAYVECVDGGIFEWNTVDDTLIHFFANVTGYLTASLGDDWILVSDASSNLVTLLLPQGDNLLIVSGAVMHCPRRLDFDTSAMLFHDIPCLLTADCFAVALQKHHHL